MAALSDGGYVVTWMSLGQDGSGWGIYAQRYDADGNAVGSETRVNTTTASDQVYPAVAALSDGGYVVTWKSRNQDGSRFGIYAQRYDADGNAVGSETRVNTTTARRPARSCRGRALGRRLRRDLDVVRPGRLRLRHLCPALRCGWQCRWQRDPRQHHDRRLSSHLLPWPRSRTAATS